MDTLDITLVGFGLAALLLSGMIHEQMHARVAYWLGDPTGKEDERFSWNPVKHLDLWMSFILPGILLVSTNGRFVFGGMKPVRINTSNFDNPPFGMALSAAAGPLTNYGLAVAGFALITLLRAVAPDFIYDEARRTLTFNGLFLCVFIFTNMLLGSFNLLPLPGLDGSRVLYFFLPSGGRALMDRIEPFALMVTMLAVWFGAAVILLPIVTLTFELLIALTGRDVALAYLTRLGYR